MSAATSYDFLIKLLLIGDSGVGKSCLLLRFRFVSRLIVIKLFILMFVDSFFVFCFLF
jgi:hypothetical protein